MEGHFNINTREIVVGLIDLTESLQNGEHWITQNSLGSSNSIFYGVRYFVHFGCIY